MRKKISIVCMTVGVLLIAAAISLALYNRLQEEHAAEAAERVLSLLHMDTNHRLKNAMLFNAFGMDLSTEDLTTTRTSVMSTGSWWLSQSLNLEISAENRIGHGMDLNPEWNGVPVL